MALPDEIEAGGAAGMEWVELLAGEERSRRPCSDEELLAARNVCERLGERGVRARLEPFRAYPTFGLPFGLIMKAAIAPALLPATARRSRSAVALLAGLGLITEGSLTHTPLSNALSRRRSQNMVATIEPAEPARRTLCLMAHIDSSRSGLIFHPRLVGQLNRWITLNSALVLAVTVGEPVIGGTRRGRSLLAIMRSLLAGSLALLAEREFRGVDVPGANDNASGCGVVLSLATRIAAEPLKSTRVVLLLTGCEEAGTLGAQAFLAAHDTRDWAFLNFDNVGSANTLRYLTREGVITHWNADPGLTAVAAEVAQRRPELRMDAESSPAGLTYDTSPVLARGGRGLTLSTQDGSIPNLHRPTDTVANVDPGGIGRALVAGAEMVTAIDRGEADR